MLEYFFLIKALIQVRFLAWDARPVAPYFVASERYIGIGVTQGHLIKITFIKFDYDLQPKLLRFSYNTGTPNESPR